ncbi:NAD(P)-dependent oxidoreductase [Silvibacterium acidisoli]|uniref:NAD(P)-dependent oxidoreductase n=1 Tax=Acidobacteriaceae bacterium ZG23-2 TaxID=2883246 RepID=UPI00406C31DD
MRIAFLGLGKMGSPIARHLLSGGHSLTVWNRTAAHAEPLAQAGAHVAATSSEAVRDAEVVFSMFTDDAAVESVLLKDGVLKSMPAGSTHVALSTISVKLSAHLAAEHHAAGQHYVAAPVFGRPNVAEDGKLWTVAAGAADALDKVQPLFDHYSRGVTIISDQPQAAHAMKLGGNFLITAMIASLSEGLAYAEATGIDPKVYMETVNQALFRSPFYEAYGKVMLTPPEKPEATIALGVKDMRLFREAAADAGAETPLANSFAATLKAAVESGLKESDWAAGYYRFVQNTTLPGEGN